MFGVDAGPYTRTRTDIVTFFTTDHRQELYFRPSDISPASLRLTSRRKLHNRMDGTPLPTEGHLSGRVDEDDRARAAGNAAAKSFLLLRSLRQAPRLVSRQSQERIARPLAPLGFGQGQAEACHRPNQRAAQAAGRSSRGHRTGLRYRRGGDGALVAPRPAWH